MLLDSRETGPARYRAAMGRLFKRLGGGVLMLVFTVWGAIRVALFFIGASTAPEDARVLVNNKWPAFARWFVETPEWSGPLALFAAIGLAAWLVWPPKEQSPVPATAKTETPPLDPQQVEALATAELRVAPTMGAPTSALLGEPFASMPPSETQPPQPHLWWQALSDVDEGPEKREARKRIVIASKRFLWPAMHALVPFYASARDAVSNQYPLGPAKDGIVRGLDLAHGGISQATKVNIHELQNPDVVAKLSLHDAISNYYYNFGNYIRSVQLSFDLIKVGKPPQGQLDIIRVAHDKWREAHDAMHAEHIRLASEDPRLDLLRTMHDDSGLKIPDQDWIVTAAIQ